MFNQLSFDKQFDFKGFLNVVSKKKVRNNGNPQIVIVEWRERTLYVNAIMQNIKGHYSPSKLMFFIEKAINKTKTHCKKHNTTTIKYNKLQKQQKTTI